jgi:hypothetical protein
MTGADFRRLALDLDGVVERQHMNHPDFRVNGRIFARLRADDTLGMVRVTPAEQRELMRAHPSVFGPASGAWGRQGCTDVHLAGADRHAVKGALILAWEGIHAMPATKARPARPASGVTRGASRTSRRRR